MKNTNKKTSCMICIGDEILSGEVQDLNLKTLAQHLGNKGIALSTAIFVKDDESQIIDNVRTAMNKYTYVFTSGGIGPTHDDITTDAVCKALGVATQAHEQSKALLEEAMGRPLNPLEQKMYIIPRGSKIIKNQLTVAPGYQIKNIFVMAGVPKIFESMCKEAMNMIEEGENLYKDQVDLVVSENEIAITLLQIAERHKNVQIGSYPNFDFVNKNNNTTRLVVRGQSPNHVDAAKKDLENSFNTYIKKH
jgi:molybdenum cofactor synthesis domain-containing protein